MCDTVSIGLDFGTSSVKAVFYGKINEGDNFSVLAVGSSSMLDIQTCNNSLGCAEQDPDTWIEAMDEAIRAALVDDIDGSISNRVASIGVSGQQHGMVAVDSEGNVIRPCMLWCDTRADAEAKQLSEFADKSVPPGYTAPKIMWFRNNERDMYDLTAKFMLPHDYINFYLSGHNVWVMEPSDCSGTGLFDPNTRGFDSKIVEYIGADLADKLPSLHLAPNAAIGLACPEVLSRLLPRRTSSAPVLLSCGGGDNAMSALGAGAASVADYGNSTNDISNGSKSLIDYECIDSERKSSCGKVVMSLGTSGTLFGSSRTAVDDPQGIVAPFCDAAGCFLPLLCIQNCAAVLEEMRLSGCSERNEESSKSTDHDSTAPSLEEITALAEQEQPGCDGVILLPYLSSGGERTPNWPHACGVLYGIRMGHMRRPGLLYRAAVEAVTMNMHRAYQHMRSCGYPAPSYIGLVGGGAQNRLWRQVIADVFQIPVSIVYGGVEGGRLCGHIGAMGAAFQAMAVYLEKDVAMFANQQCRALEAAVTRADSNEQLMSVEPNSELRGVYEGLSQRRTALENILMNSQGWA